MMKMIKILYLSKGHKFNPQQNEYVSLNDSLNNETNPFIIANNLINKQNSKDNNEYKNNLENKMNPNNTNNDIKNTKEIDLTKETEKNKFNYKPAYNFDFKEEKEIDSKYIEKLEEDKIIEYMTTNENNYWYKNLRIYGKKFFQMTKNSVAKSSEYIIYYCHFHNTTIDSIDCTNKGYKKNCQNVMKGLLF